MISHKHKCIFIHIPKTAGTSIYKFFFPEVNFHYAKPDYERLFGWCPERKLHMQHATAKQLLQTELISQEHWDTYFKFAFVRNPWDRAYSDYKWVQSFAHVTGSFKDYITGKGAFKEIFNNVDSPQYLGDHLMSQIDFVEMPKPHQLDFIGSFENFDKDIKTVLLKLNIQKEFLLHKNRSHRNKDYSLFYTNSNRKLVALKYKEDIEKFDYTFEDNRKGLYWVKKWL